MIFYLLIILILAGAIFLFAYQRKQKKKPRLQRRRAPVVNLDIDSLSSSTSGKNSKEVKFQEESNNSPYDPNLIILQLNAFPGKSYMGYELHQAILASGLRFGDGNIFHCYSGRDKNKILFSLAAATSSGSFAVDDMGSFKCNGLLLFICLEPRKKLMASFDLMLDIARQLTEELGGEIYDDLQNVINADAIKRLRERICQVETSNLYVSDLLDNLD